MLVYYLTAASEGVYAPSLFEPVAFSDPSPPAQPKSGYVYRPLWVSVTGLGERVRTASAKWLALSGLFMEGLGLRLELPVKRVQSVRGHIIMLVSSIYPSSSLIAGCAPSKTSGHVRED